MDVVASSALAWRVDAPGELIRGGAIRSTPAGYEEALLRTFPGALRRAAMACRADGGPQPDALLLSFEVSAVSDGSLRPPGEPPADLIARCLVDRFTHDQRAPTGVVARIEVRLQLER